MSPESIDFFLEVRMLHCIKKFFLNLRLRKALAEHAKFPGETEKVGLARLYLRLSLIDDARAVIQDGLATFPGSRRLREAGEEIRRARAILMLEAMEQVLEDEPSAENFIKASDLARVAGDMDRAFSYAHEGMVAFPESWAVHLALGKLHFHRYNSGRETVDGIECLKHLDKARRIAPEEPRVLFFLAMGHAVQGEQREALSVVELLTARYPDYPKATALRRRIREAIAAEGAGSSDRESLEETASRIQAALAPLGLDAGSVREQLSRVDGVIGWFFMDEEGEVIASHTKDDLLFDLSDPSAGLHALAATRFGSSRIGIGDLESLSMSGDGWEIHLHALGDLSFVAFSKGMSSSGVEDLVNQIVKAVPVPCGV